MRIPSSCSQTLDQPIKIFEKWIAIIEDILVRENMANRRDTFGAVKQYCHVIVFPAKDFCFPVLSGRIYDSKYLIKFHSWSSEISEFFFKYILQCPYGLQCYNVINPMDCIYYVLNFNTFFIWFVKPLIAHRVLIIWFEDYEHKKSFLLKIF